MVKENQISSFNLADIRTRNLSQSGLDHGIQLFKTNTTPYLAPVSKNLNNGQYTITYDPANNENNSPLPYSHYAMINSSASINDATRNTRLFVSSYPDAFNLAFFGEKDGLTNYSLSFDGLNDYVYVDNNYNLLPMSMQVLFKGNFSGIHNGIITTDTPSKYGQSIDVHNGKLGVEVQNGFYSSDIEVSNDTWYNTTAVFTDGAVKL